MNNKVIAIIQARLGSSRLPGKVLKKLGNKTVIEHVVNRTKRIENLDKVIVATTESKLDDELVKYLKEKEITFFRGSEEDVLQRYYYAALEYNAETIIRITSDCPLIDPDVSSKMLKIYLESDYDMVSNASSDSKNRTFPRGLDTEIFSFELLKRAYKNADKKYQREHVTPYLYENEKNIFFYKNKVDYSNYRWTLDTPEDYSMLKDIFENFNDENEIRFKNIINFLENNPSVKLKNSKIIQKKLGE